MNDFRKQWLEDREKFDIELFEKIKNNSRPSVSELWALSEERFIEWRKINDFPKLLNHFDKTLLLFEEWKQAYNLSNEIIIQNGELTPFLECKKLAEKDKYLYLTKQKWDNKETTFVSYKTMPSTIKQFDIIYNFELILKFVPYLDWLKFKGKEQNILYINSRSDPRQDLERVWIHKDIYAPSSDFELLKMGGIVIPTDRFGILKRGKKIEFANLCGLKFQGDIYFGEEGNLSCSYCACDNWEAEGLNMPSLELEHCTVTNFNLSNSTLQQWRFYDCVVNGDFFNSKLVNVDIYGGAFNPIMLDCNLSNTNILTDLNITNHNYNGYKNFKKIYQNQGDDDIAKKYFVLENEFLRSKLKGWDFFTKSLSYYYWEYGSKPHRIIYLSLFIIFSFALVYWLGSDFILANTTSKSFTIWDSIYFSTITFTTLGYGDYSPMSWLKIFSSIEAFLGVINMGFLIAGYANNKY